MSDHSFSSPLRLAAFLPYRLSILANRVSDLVARTYAPRFGLSVAEWRTVAVLGESGALSANEVAARAAMDKVKVSRAVGRLVARGHVRKVRHPRDKRILRLSLTRRGSILYKEIIPCARDVERRLLEAFDDSEKHLFFQFVGRLQARADELRGDDEAS